MLPYRLREGNVARLRGEEVLTCVMSPERKNNKHATHDVLACFPDS